jgi:cytochrome b pre-mRNA-processing protein 3
MSFLSNLFGGKRKDRDPVRPLWHRVVEIAREKHWYAQGGIADSVPGRFDAITLVLALVTLRMERDEALAQASALLTELFVEDMDGQLRQTGVGDPTVGKHIGKLMQALGGRIGALRVALPEGEAALVPVLERNLTLIENADLARLASATMALWKQLEAMPADDLLAGRISR